MVFIPLNTNSFYILEYMANPQQNEALEIKVYISTCCILLLLNIQTAKVAGTLFSASYQVLWNIFQKK
jgi:hypothetical protein